LRVLRPSIVVGDAPATAGGAPSNLFFDFVRLLSWAAARGAGRARGLRVPGAPGAPFNIVPVEYVADATIALAEHPAARGGTFHLVTSAPPTQAETLAMLADILGLAGARVVAAGEMTGERSAVEARLSRLLAAYGEYLSQDVRFDDREARRVLDAAGVRPATLTPDDIGRLVRSALAAERVA
jgi:nucleoside-diphosphate-sugar epimerase